MTRLKLILFTLISIVFLASVLFVVSREILLESFIEIENEHMEENLTRVDSALLNFRNTLSIKLRDWSEWDDTVSFIQDRNEAYIESNLSNSTLANLEINYIAFFDAYGNLVYSIGITLPEGEPVFSDALSQQIVTEKPEILSIEKGSRVSKIITNQNKLLLIEALPVTKTSGVGEKEGVIFFGRYIDSNLIKNLEEITQLDLTYTKLSDEETSETKYAGEILNQNKEQHFIQAQSKQKLQGFTAIYESSEKLAGIIKVAYDRKIFNQGLKTVSIFIYVSSGMILAFGILILLAFEVLLLRQLTRLSKEVENISIDNLSSTHISMGKNDEVGTLANTIRELLSQLTKAHAEETLARNLEKEATKKLKKSVEETREINRLMVDRELKMIELKKKLSETEHKNN